jgi:SAM-dependent methyltransferase
MNKSIFTWEDAVLWLRAQPDQQELVRACYYDDPLLDAAARYESCEEWQSTLDILPKRAGLALDLGAGRGISSYALAKAGWRVDALEPDASPVVGRGAIQQLAKDAELPIYPAKGFAEEIPSQNEKYDLVYGRQVMHHARSLPKMCAEIARVLKRGGVFIATREHVISKRDDLPVFLAGHPLHHLYGGENAFLLREYLKAIEDAGLVIKSILRPYESPINLFPITNDEWKNQVREMFSKRISKFGAHLLLSDALPWSGVIHSAFSRYKSYQSQTPGRLYSFVVVKR